MLRLRFFQFAIMLFFLSGVSDAYWSLEGRDDTPIVSVHGATALDPVPLLLVYRDGTIVWSEHYFAAQYGAAPEAGWKETSSLPEGQSIESRRAAWRKILDGVDPDDPTKLARILDAAATDPILSRRVTADPTLLLVTQVAPQAVSDLVEVLYNVGFESYSGPDDALVEGTSITVALIDEYFHHAVAGSFGYYYNPKGDFFDLSGDKLNARRNRTLVWQDLLSGVFSIVNLSENRFSAVLNTQQAEYRPFDDPWLRESELRLRKVEALQTMEESPESAAQFLATVKAMWDSADRRTAIAYLESTVPELDLAAQGHAYETLGGFHVAEQNFERARECYLAALRHSSVPSANALIRLGYLALRAGNRPAALRYFGSVSYDKGPVAGTEEQLDEANMRSAVLLRRLRQGDKAIELFDHIVSTSDNEDTIDQMGLQRIALVFEKAKGDFGEVEEPEQRELLIQTRELASQYLERPNISSRQRSVVELMRLETYYYDNDFSECIQRAEDFIAKWQDWKPRDEEKEEWNVRQFMATAHNYQMLSLFHIGDYEQAIRECGEIRQKYDAGDPFSAFNVFAYSHLYEGLALEALGRQQEANSSFTECREQYQSWYMDHGMKKLQAARKILAARSLN